MTGLLTTSILEGRGLATATIDGVSAAELPATLASALTEGAAVLGWSGATLAVCRLVGGQLVGADGRAVPTAGWFGARAFDGLVDARWNLQAGVGTLVAVREASSDAGAPVDARIDGVRYLVFGERDATEGGWAFLSAANVGSLTVPDPGGSGRIAIEAVEYVQFDADGNADVVDELLIGFVDAEVQR